MTVVSIPLSFDIGAIVADKYEIREVVGVGGFAIVFRATEVNVGRDVALKVLRPDKEGYGGDRIARFMRESRVHASLQDPHTITMFDFGQTPDGYLYMVFEYVRGADLAELLEAHGRLDERIVRHILGQLLEALREAHRAGILHRDLKPQNVLVYEYMGDPFRVKLIDFGIAKYLEPGDATIDGTLTLTGRVVGTLLYMAPEQLLDQELTPASDIYSLGLLAYQLLTGAPAVAANETRERISKQLREDKSLPNDASVSPAFRAIVDKMTRRKPAHRYQSADECLAALDALDAPLEAPLTQIDERSKRTLVAAVVCLVLGVAAGSSFLLLLQPESDSGRRSGERLATAEKSARALQTRPPDVARPKPPPVEAELEIEIVGDDGGTGADRPDADVGDWWLSVGCGEPTKITSNGFVEHALNIGPVQSRWGTFIGTRYQPTQPHALIVAIPDTFRSGGQTVHRIGMGALAEEHNLIVTAPKIDTLPAVTKNDLYFIRDAIEEVQRTLCIDLRKVYAIGSGASGRVVENLPCVTDLTAIATVSYRGARAPWLCPEPRPTPHITVTANEDPHQPIDGGIGCSGTDVISLDEREDVIQAKFGCRDERAAFVRDDAGVCWAWSCDATFVSCRIDGGYGWPHPKARGENLGEYLFGRDCPDSGTPFPTARTILRFFFAEGEFISPR